MKNITIYGSTGSIGTQLLNILRKRQAEFNVVALAAGSNYKLLCKQIKEFQPKYIYIHEVTLQEQIRTHFPKIQLIHSPYELASLDNIDIFYSCVVGIAGLEANLRALETTTKVAIANKETLVVAPHLVNKLIAKYNTELMPVDSEHVAIHQCLTNSTDTEIKEILLTSSGGPFRTLSLETLQKVTKADALKHPTWNMGNKITIDSSTMMNKALEIIEVNSLFNISYDKIKVIIHPQSIMHSAVSFHDGNIIAQLGTNNMEIPIQYALDFPKRHKLATKDNFSIFGHNLEFYEPDLNKFPALSLAYEVGKIGGSLLTVFNSANEAAVELFLQDRIQYLEIYKTIESAVSRHKNIQTPDLNTILEIDKEIRYKIKESF